MSTDDSTTETADSSTIEVEEPPRPEGVSDEKWAAFEAKFDAFAERVEKGLTAKRPATPKAQTVSTPSKKPVTEEKKDAAETPPVKKKAKGYWG